MSFYEEFINNLFSPGKVYDELWSRPKENDIPKYDSFLPKNLFLDTEDKSNPNTPNNLGFLTKVQIKFILEEASNLDLLFLYDKEQQKTLSCLDAMSQLILSELPSDNYLKKWIKEKYQINEPIFELDTPIVKDGKCLVLRGYITEGNK
jgi:hypothetical protein